MGTELFCVNLVLCFLLLTYSFLPRAVPCSFARNACHSSFVSPLPYLNFSSSSSQAFISSLWWRGGEEVGRDVLPLGKRQGVLPCDKVIVLQELHEWFLHSGGIVTVELVGSKEMSTDEATLHSINSSPLLHLYKTWCVDSFFFC